MKTIIVLLAALAIHPRHNLVAGTVHEAEVNGNQASIKIGKGRTAVALQNEWRQATDEEVEAYHTPEPETDADAGPPADTSEFEKAQADAAEAERIAQEAAQADAAEAGKEQSDQPDQG